MKCSLLNGLLLSLLLLVRQAVGLPIIDDIVKFGQKINNNQAVEQFSLQIVPMSTRVKLLTFGEQQDGFSASFERFSGGWPPA